jgi:hypothetical protein
MIFISGSLPRYPLKRRAITSFWKSRLAHSVYIQHGDSQVPGQNEEQGGDQPKHKDLQKISKAIKGIFDNRKDFVGSLNLHPYS